MPNKRYLAGRRFEYKVKRVLEKNGWEVLRTSGSHGLYDLICIRDILWADKPFRHFYIRFLQLKKNITHNKAEQILQSILRKTCLDFEKCKIVDMNNSNSPYQCKSFIIESSLLFRDTQDNVRMVNLIMDFGVIYTLPKKKKFNKRKKIV
jgi:hypothetical protein